MTELNWQELWDEDEQRYRVRTRDGRKVRIWTTDAYCGAPVRGEIKLQTGWIAMEWDTLGRSIFSSQNKSDLIPEPRTVRRWVNVARVDSTYYFIGPFAAEATARIAQQKHPTPGYRDTVPVEWEE